jgi:hypothetical protein
MRHLRTSLFGFALTGFLALTPALAAQEQPAEIATA